MQQDISKTRGGVLQFTFNTGGLPVYVNTGGTVKIMDNSATSSAISPAITAAAITYGATTTLTAAATAGNRSLQCLSTSGFIVGKTVIVGPNVNGFTEANVIDAISTGQVITLKRDLAYSHASGVAVKDPELKYTLTSTAATALDHQWNCIAEWTFGYNSHTYKEWQYFNITPQVLRPPVNADMLVNEERRLEEKDREDVQVCIDRAWEDIVFDVRSRGYRPGLVIDTGLLRKPHIELSLAYCYQRLFRRSENDTWDMLARDMFARGGSDLASALNRIHYDESYDRTVGDETVDKGIGTKRFRL